jgi:hypothetical protein
VPIAGWADPYLSTLKEKLMSKGKSSKGKEAKKKPVMTLKEKRAAKKTKSEASTILGVERARWFFTDRKNCWYGRLGHACVQSILLAIDSDPARVSDLAIIVSHASYAAWLFTWVGLSVLQNAVPNPIWVVPYHWAGLDMQFPCIWIYVSGEKVISFPRLECWNATTRVVTVAADVDKRRVLCRISLDILRDKFGESKKEPMQFVAQHRAAIQDVARAIIENGLFEEDGSVVIRAGDFSPPMPDSNQVLV